MMSKTLLMSSWRRPLQYGEQTLHQLSTTATTVEQEQAGFQVADVMPANRFNWQITSCWGQPQTEGTWHCSLQGGDQDGHTPANRANQAVCHPCPHHSSGTRQFARYLWLVSVWAWGLLLRAPGPRCIAQRARQPCLLGTHALGSVIPQTQVQRTGPVCLL